MQNNAGRQEKSSLALPRETIQTRGTFFAMLYAFYSGSRDLHWNVVVAILACSFYLKLPRIAKT
jgi:hypothetical protein